MGYVQPAVRCLLLSGIIATSSPGHAETKLTVVVARAVENGINESFDDVAKVNGFPVAGLRIGHDDKAFDPDNILLLLPPRGTTLICVRGLTQDGRFLSRNTYYAQGDADLPVLAKLQPFTHDYNVGLARYSSGDLAVVGALMEGASCESRPELYLPQVSNNYDKNLYLAINSRNRSARLLISRKSPDGESTEMVEANCNKIDGKSRIAYDTQCVADLNAGPSGFVQAELELDDGFGAERHDFRLFLPARK